LPAQSIRLGKGRRAAGSALPARHVDDRVLKEIVAVAEYRCMASTPQPERMFDVALSPEDGRIRITRCDTGRVSLALTTGEASQIRAGLKGALRPKSKKLKKSRKRKNS